MTSTHRWRPICVTLQCCTVEKVLAIKCINKFSRWSPQPDKYVNYQINPILKANIVWKWKHTDCAHFFFVVLWWFVTFSSGYTTQSCASRRQTAPLVWGRCDAAVAEIRLPATILQSRPAASWLLVIMYELSIRRGFREQQLYCISGYDLRTICGLQTESGDAGWRRGVAIWNDCLFSISHSSWFPAGSRRREVITDTEARDRRSEHVCV